MLLILSYLLLDLSYHSMFVLNDYTTMEDEARHHFEPTFPAISTTQCDNSADTLCNIANDVSNVAHTTCIYFIPFLITTSGCEIIFFDPNK